MINNKYYILLLVITVLLVVSVITGTSYSLWVVTEEQTGSNVIETGCFEISITENSNLSLTNTYPISDASGLRKTPYSVTVKNTCTINSQLDIWLNPMATSSMSVDAIKVAYGEKGNIGSPVLLNTLNDIKSTVAPSDSTYSHVYELISTTLAPDATKTYEVYMWMDINATNDEMGKTFNSKIIVNNRATN